jgi:hypothetical protein
MAWLNGKEMIFFIVPPLGEAPPYLHTFWETDNDANKISFDLS